MNSDSKPSIDDYLSHGYQSAQEGAKKLYKEIFGSFRFFKSSTIKTLDEVIEAGLKLGMIKNLQEGEQFVRSLEDSPYNVEYSKSGTISRSLEFKRIGVCCPKFIIRKKSVCGFY